MLFLHYPLRTTRLDLLGVSYPVSFKSNLSNNFEKHIYLIGYKLSKYRNRRSNNDILLHTDTLACGCLIHVTHFIPLRGKAATTTTRTLNATISCLPRNGYYAMRRDAGRGGGPRQSDFRLIGRSCPLNTRSLVDSEGQPPPVSDPREGNTLPSKQLPRSSPCHPPWETPFLALFLSHPPTHKRRRDVRCDKGGEGITRTKTLLYISKYRVSREIPHCTLFFPQDFFFTKNLQLVSDIFRKSLWTFLSLYETFKKLEQCLNF